MESDANKRVIASVLVRHVTAELICLCVYSECNGIPKGAQSSGVFRGTVWSLIAAWNTLPITTC